jgi:hypothetical protein
MDAFTPITDANFYVAICSDRPISIPNFVYVPASAHLLKERGTRIESLEKDLALKNTWLEEAQKRHAELVYLHAQQTQELRANNTWANELDAQVKAAGQRILALQDEAAAQHQAALAMAEGYESRLRTLEADLQARTEWAQNTEARMQQQVEDVRSDLVKCTALLDQAEATVVERTNWALQLQRDLEQAHRQLALAKASRWIKLGRIMKIGPELNP